jgi:hypothetical protein
MTILGLVWQLQIVILEPRICVQALGDEYIPPVGLPEWKQPSFDDDDHVDPDKFQNAAPQVRRPNAAVWKNFIVVN